MQHLLCIDIGNTHIVIALMEGEKAIDSMRIPSSPLLSHQAYLSHIKSMLSKSEHKDFKIHDSVLSSVVPRLTKALSEVAHQLSGKNPLVVDHTLPMELDIKYDDPSEVGADRICNAVGALKKYKAPLIVVDMGTATTFDVISEKNEYLGGVIMPGLETAGRDLFQRAAKLPKVSFDFPEKVIGTKTRESLQAGLMWGTIDQIDGLIERVKDEWGKEEVSVIATGGLSVVIAPHSRYIQKVDKDLTLVGMVNIYRQVRG